MQRALAADVDLSVSSAWQLATLVARGARPAGDRARVHLKIDTGLSRNGATSTTGPTLVAAAAAAQAAGEIEVVGVWSHFAYADEPGHPTIARQIAAFGDALEVAARAGVEPQLRHLANSAATLTLPDGALRPRPARHRRLRAVAGAPSELRADARR